MQQEGVEAQRHSSRSRLAEGTEERAVRTLDSVGFDIVDDGGRAKIDSFARYYYEPIILRVRQAIKKLEKGIPKKSVGRTRI